MLLQDVIPAGASWRLSGANGFRYRKMLAAGAHGVTAATLKPGADGAAKVVVSTDDGPNLPALPLPLPANVQLYGHGECWGATYDAAGVRRNSATGFTAKSAP